jgi:hypothetical protein
MSTEWQNMPVRIEHTKGGKLFRNYIIGIVRILYGLGVKQSFLYEIWNKITDIQKNGILWHLNR